MTPNAYSSCSEILTSELEDQPIGEIILDPMENTLNISYNPDLLALDDLKSRLKTPRKQIQENFLDCPLRESTANTDLCPSCRKYTKLAKDRNQKGLVHIPIGAPHAETWIHLSLGKEEQADKPSLLKSFRRMRDKITALWNSIPWEAVFVVLALGFMISGVILEKSNPNLAFWLFMGSYLFGGIFGFMNGFKTLLKLQIDIDFLMVGAAVGAAVIGEPFEGALLLFLFSLSNVLQDFALGRTKAAIKSLMDLRPAKARVLRQDKAVMIPVEAVGTEEIVLVKPGEKIPLDGDIITGHAALDQAVITGESVPVDKGPGDPVLGGSINTNGSLEIKVTKAAADSTIARIIHLVESAREQKAQTQSFLDDLEQKYSLGVVIFTLLVWWIPIWFLGEGFSTAFYRAMTVMVAASPCALIISTPAVILSAIGNAARKGILFKGGLFMEKAGTIDTLAFDKTGTLTQGKPTVTDFVSLEPGRDILDLLSLFYTLESHSEHPLAKAAVAYAREKGAQILDSADFSASAGKGVEARVEGQLYFIKNLRYLGALNQERLQELAHLIAPLESQGKTTVFLCRETGGKLEVLAYCAFQDRSRPESRAVVAELHRLGIKKVVMLTGDNQRTADHIAQELGIDEVRAELLPENKQEIIQELKDQGAKVAMIGDGVNDAPALALADLGIAMGGAGTDVAMETADVVLMGDELEKIPYLVDLSRKTRRTLWFNLGLAFSLIFMMIGAIFFFDLPLPLAVLGHEGGTVLVSLNGLRLFFSREAKPAISVSEASAAGA